MSSKILISYLAAFSVGVGVTIGVSSFYYTEDAKNLSLLATELKGEENKTSIHTRLENHQAHNLADTTPLATQLITASDNDQLIALQDENTALKQQVEQLTNQLKQRKAHIENTLQQSPIMKTFKENKIKLSRLENENTRLMAKLAQYDPELVASITLTPENKAQLPKKISDKFEQLPFKHRKEIANFVNQQDKLNEGDNTAQKILDFIAMHPESYNIKNQSVICKQNQCEIYIENAIGREELEAQGYTAEQIREHVKGLTTNNSYKNIINDMMEQLHLRNNVHYLNPFSGYYLLNVPTPA